MFISSNSSRNTRIILKNILSFQHIPHYSIMTSSKPFVFLTRPDIAPSSIQLLKEKCDVDMYEKGDIIPRAELLKRIVGKQGIYCTAQQQVNKEFLNASGPQLKVIGTMSVGFEHIDVEECKKRNIIVGYTPDVLTDAVADLTVALLLATTRRLMEGFTAVKDGSWGAWRPDWLCGRGLKNSTVGIVGLGRIGEAVLHRLRPFGVQRFLYSGRSQKPNAKQLGAEYVTFEELLAQSDFVVALCSVNESTKGIFDEKAFSLMKPTAVFVNVGRGVLVNQDALLHALKSGKIRAAGLDVTTPEPLPLDHPLQNLPNCVIIPHIGSADVETRIGMAELTARNIIAGLEGKELPARLC